MTTLLNSMPPPDPTGGPLNQMYATSKVQQDIDGVSLFTKFIKSSDEAAQAAL